MRSTTRRFVTIPGFVLAWLLLVVLFPPMAVVAVLVDGTRRDRFVTLRVLAMVHVYFAAEVAGIAVAGYLWLTRGRDSERYLDRNFRLQCWWAGVLFGAGRRLFNLDVVVDGDEHVSPGPVLVFVRHVSPIDNLIPAVFISGRYGIRLRWVINRILLRDPCLDLVGNRLPNCFVSAGTSDSDAEIARVRALAEDLGPNDGVLIFPEGALYSPARRKHILERLAAGGDTARYEQAARLQHVLLPRLGGALALLETSDADVVFCAHAGLDRAIGYRSIAAGLLAGAPLRIHFWRVARAAIPATRADRAAWLFEQWVRIDTWVAANTAPPIRAGAALSHGQ